MLKAISTITNALGALNYKGTWNASTNNPALADGTGSKGDYYVVSTAGTQTFGGVQLFFGTGDWIAYNGAVWQRVEGGSDGNFANVTMTSTDAGAAAAPTLDLYRDSASPAISDTLGEIEFNGEDSAGNKQAYGLIHASILSPTSTAEQGQLHFETATAGALTEKMIIGTTNLVVNEIGAVFNVRIEGDTDANLLYTDATNDRIGVGTVSPSVKFEVNGAAKASSLSLTTALPTTSGGTALSSFTSGGVVYASSTSALATGSVLKFDGTNLGIGTVTTAAGVLDVEIAVGAEGVVYCIMRNNNGTKVNSLVVNSVSTESYNGAVAALWVGRAAANARSINAGGTVNASGADYAEYMTKAGDFTVAKGDVVGIDANGKLTNVFADAVTFVVKSTDPSYVGGDTWGNEESIGLTKPNDDSTEAEKNTFNAALEAARQTVDRISFSGQVPVNVTGASAGQYIIPVNNNGAIKGEAVSNPTFEQYKNAVGKVIATEADGRAKIIVKVI